MKQVFVLTAFAFAVALAAGCSNDVKSKGTAAGIPTALTPTGDSSNMPQAPPLKGIPGSPK